MTSYFSPYYGTRNVLSVPGGAPGAYGVFARARLDTDSAGNFTLTLTNLIVGSSIQIETQAGAAIENRVAAATSEVFTIPAYSAGSSLNDLHIKVRKGSAAPYYKPYETQATAVVGVQSIFIAQQLDE